ncbi:MAG: DNA-3-methyladenine glycosylase [Synergistaceae bacterium]|nr:DNA-3-methyladenine glycosylase [Synergistaceae bacterium]MBQ6910078.1 DNA-3-methyladenine glycosylase [Synergistaceae bacterium]MBQ9581377.1 DNA-3-methyladenine glycosylase [Synergistaceae bacterium]MBQ9896441.1 DNA-3-methyladenine glycosylase [Synergistaceae bacterium]
MRDTLSVAKDLLGKTLIKYEDNKILSGIIIETEAYLGFNDAACHSFKISAPKPGHRTEAMFEAGGCAYVYLIYGVYNCFNIVTREAGTAQAVLIRALEPVSGLELMRERRNKIKAKDLCSGPGKLCQAFNITREFNKLKLYSPESKLQVHDNNLNLNKTIIASPRVNVDYAGQDALLNYNFKLI